MNTAPNITLDASDCWEYLRRTSVGRLAVIIEDSPEIFPVNFAIEHSAIVIRTGDGAKVDAIRANPGAAFEIDGIEPDSGTAWSVVLKGSAKEITHPDELRDTVSLDLSPVQSGTKNHFIRITAEVLTGRRFTVADPSAWETPLSHVARAPQE